MENNHSKTDWSSDANRGGSNLYINSIRKGEVVGNHEVIYFSDYDSITLAHKAMNRKAFAEGAVIAAEWLLGRTGFFTMNDVLGL
jgi:4-hydroxy-tetrahydrodipicolinate reductase